MYAEGPGVFAGEPDAEQRRMVDILCHQVMADIYQNMCRNQYQILRADREEGNFSCYLQL